LGQEAAGDSLGLVSGVDGLDRSGLLGGDETSGAVDDEAPGLLQPMMAPTRATASRMLLIMRSLLGLRFAGGTPAWTREPGRPEPIEQGAKDPATDRWQGVAGFSHWVVSRERLATGRHPNDNPGAPARRSFRP
jgi:hypothetical protein